MTIYTTANFGLAYADTDTPLDQLAEVTRRVATTTDEALTRGGVAAPEAQDLTAVAGRVSTLEDPPTLRVLKTGSQLVGTTWAAVTWAAPPVTETWAAQMWGGNKVTGNTTRIYAPKAGRYRLTATLLYQHTTLGGRNLQARLNSAGVVSGGTQLDFEITGAAQSWESLKCDADSFIMAANDHVEVFAYSAQASTEIGPPAGYTAVAFALAYIGK